MCWTTGTSKWTWSPPNGRFMANILACVASFQSDQQSEAIRGALLWCKQNGLAYHGKCAIGKKRIHLPCRKGERRGRVMDVWDEKECRQIREIVSRHDAGETLHAIAQDFLARDERTAMGARWVHPARGYKRTGRKRTRPDDSRIYRAYNWYKRLRAEGKDLGAPPEGNGDRRQSGAD